MAGKNRLMARLVAASATVTPDSDYIATNLTKTQPQAVGLSVYSSIDSLPTSAATGTKAFVTSNNTLYFYNSGWYKIAIINSFNPQWITQPNGTYNLAVNGTATSITVLASDSDDVPITYIATPDSDFLTFATVTQDSDKDNTWIIQPVDSENGTAVAGTGTVTFRASDGVNLVSAVSTFSLSFGPNWSVAPTESIIRASDGQAGEWFGGQTNPISLSDNGEYAIVGAQRSKSDGNSGGAAYVFTRSGSTWTQQQKLLSSDITLGDEFGYSACLSGDGTRAIVGARNEDTNASTNGTVYIFSRSGSTWTEEAYIRGPVSNQGSLFFGETVTMNYDGSYIAVGGRDDSNSSNQGAVWVYSRSGTTWTLQQKLTHSDAQPNDYFGLRVSISGDALYIIISAHAEDGGSGDPTSNAGAAYVFSRSGSTWTQQAKLVDPSPSVNGYFGQAVDINSDGTYAVACKYTDNSSAGAIFVFTRSGSTWTQQAKLTASDAQISDNLAKSGCSISANGSFVVGGAHLEAGGSGDPLSSAGAAYVFERDGSSWSQVKKLTASDAQAGDQYGTSADISSDGAYVIVGARYEDGGAGDPTSASGAAYIYEAG